MPHRRFAHLAQRLFNVPLAIHPRKAEIVMASMAERFGIAHLFRGAGTPAALFDGLDDDAEAASSAPYAVVDGVAIIPIEGTLVQKLGTLQPYSGMTGYDGIRQCLGQALGDDNVRAIMLDIDSPGGEVAGCFDLVDEIFYARGSKPIWAALDENAYSAAYAIASAADRVLIPRTGGAGSVGVITMHVDFSKALAKDGIDVTLITYGDHKADGSQYAPLPAGVRDRFQADIDAMGTIFVETVARNRGMSPTSVQATQAGCFMGPAAVGIGFADAIATPQAVLSALRTVQ